MNIFRLIKGGDNLRNPECWKAYHCWLEAIFKHSSRISENFSYSTVIFTEKEP